MSLQAAITAGNAAASTTAQQPEPHWFPCGFAWVTYKCRKNAKQAKDLIANDFSWDDYRREYSLSGGRFHNTQSMDHKENIVMAFATAANEKLTPGEGHFSTRTYID